MSIHFGSVFRFENVPHRCTAECEECSVKVSLPVDGSDKVFKDIYIERCILPELKALWKQGIKTKCSCCGHGVPFNAFITVEKEFAEKMEAMGYESPPDMLDVCNSCNCGAMFVPKAVLGEEDYAEKQD